MTLRGKGRRREEGKKGRRKKEEGRERVEEG
jgi:hypothetical protein